MVGLSGLFSEAWTIIQPQKGERRAGEKGERKIALKSRGLKDRDGESLTLGNSFPWEVSELNRLP